MSNRKRPGAKGSKTGFSDAFDAALLETRIIDAFVRADGWSLTEFTNAPAWLRQVYTRHAVAACREILESDSAEINHSKPL